MHQPVCTMEEAGQLLESLRATYLALDPEDRRRVKSFLSELLRSQSRVALVDAEY